MAAPRSPAEATRFTATSPHAYTRYTGRAASSMASSMPPGSAAEMASGGAVPNGAPTAAPGSEAPPSETPQQKVARLRAMRMAQRQVHLTTWERTVIRGRVWADVAHRSTILILQGTAVAFAVGGLISFTDMTMHNRKKRKAFQSELHKIYNTRLVAAIETEKAGISLSDDQLVILSRERQKLAAAQQKKELGIWGRTKRTLAGSLSYNMGGRHESEIHVPTEAETLEKIGIRNQDMLASMDGKATLNERGELENMQPLGSGATSATTVPRIPPQGPQEDTQRIGKTSDTSSSWWNWFGKK